MLYGLFCCCSGLAIYPSPFFTLITACFLGSSSFFGYFILLLTAGFKLFPSLLASESYSSISKSGDYLFLKSILIVFSFPENMGAYSILNEDWLFMITFCTFLLPYKYVSGFGPVCLFRLTTVRLLFCDAFIPVP